MYSQAWASERKNGGVVGGVSLFEHLRGENDGLLLALQSKFGALRKVESGPVFNTGQLPLLQKLLFLL